MAWNGDKMYLPDGNASEPNSWNKQYSSSTVLDLSLVYVQWRQEITLFPMVKASEFVANEPLLSLVQDVGVNIASVSAVQDGTDAFADLRYSDRRCPFFSPAGLLSPKTTWQ